MVEVFMRKNTPMCTHQLKFRFLEGKGIFGHRYQYFKEYSCSFKLPRIPEINFDFNVQKKLI